MQAVFAELAAILAPVYHRRDLRQNALLYLRGLPAPQVAGNCWSIAEAVGLDLPYRLHHLLEPAAWDEDRLGVDPAHSRRQLLIRRSITDPSEIAYFCAYAPAGYVCSLTDMVKIAGTRWKVEDDFQDAKSTVGLDQTQVRLYRAWKRQVTVAMAALAFLAVVAAIEKAAHPAPVLPDDPDQTPPADCGVIPLTVPETQRLFHLFTMLTGYAPTHAARARLALHLAWSDGRRRHQARARWHHYRTRLASIA